MADRALKLRGEHLLAILPIRLRGGVHPHYVVCRWPTKKGPRGQLKRDPLAEFPARG